MTALGWICLGLALLPLLLGLWNLCLFRTPRDLPPPDTALSILIPARNEEASIGDAVRAALASRGLVIEVVVLDDQSSDRTAAIVEELAAFDPRVRLLPAPPLPEGWSGKQHACAVLAAQARFPLLLFQDADVRLEADGAARAAAFLLHRPVVALASGFPRQITGTLAEQLLIPQMHVLLLGYLPMAFMRLFRASAFAAGCGQLMLVRADAYRQAGGHGAIRTSLHDGVMLPRAFRRAGLRTDLFDATALARCRMYRGWEEVRGGLSKNATEGMATPWGLPLWTLLLGGGHVLPWPLLPAATLAGADAALELVALAAAASLLFRLLLTLRFRQRWPGSLLHPAGVALMLWLQFQALRDHRRGQPARWRGRSYPQAG